jgi:hypothetical protein
VLLHVQAIQPRVCLLQMQSIMPLLSGAAEWFQAALLHVSIACNAGRKNRIVELQEHGMHVTDRDSASSRRRAGPQLGASAG